MSFFLFSVHIHIFQLNTQTLKCLLYHASTYPSIHSSILQTACPSVGMLEAKPASQAEDTLDRSPVYHSSKIYKCSIIVNFPQFLYCPVSGSAIII